MLAHFDKLGTTLRPVLKYQTTTAQEERFYSRGWQHAVARNLWELWSSADLLSEEDRIAVNNVEPFDEWEEFALFGCHYTLLVAHNKSIGERPQAQVSQTLPPTANNVQQPSRVVRANELDPEFGSSEIPKKAGNRRFAAPIVLRGQNNHPDLAGNFGGHGLKGRLDSTDVFSEKGEESLYSGGRVTKGPSSRLCHTVTELGDAGSLLVGGRTSPDNALADCWLFHKLSATWERVQDLPIPLYRHSAVSIDNDSVLVLGGKTDSKTIVTRSFLWNRKTGWLECDESVEDHNTTRPVVFGAVLLINRLYEEDYLCANERGGHLCGGITTDGVVSQRAIGWVLIRQNKVCCQPYDIFEH